MATTDAPSGTEESTGESGVQGTTDDGTTDDGGSSSDDAGATDDAGSTDDGTTPVEPGDCGEIWNSEVIEDFPFAGNLHLGSTIQLGPDGTLHAFFNSNGAAFHAARVGGIWQVTEWPGIGSIWASAGTIDDDGVVHFAYRDNGPGMVSYHRLDGAVWTTETIPFGACSAASMQLGDDGTVHIAGHLGEDVLCYGTRSPAGLWSTETVTDAFHRGASLQLDDDGAAHISFYSPGLRYANNVGGNWTVENLGSGGIDSTMVMDDMGGFVIGHSESPSGTIQITTGEPGSWSDELIAASSANFHTAAPGVALGGAGQLHAVHPDPTDERCLVHRERDDEASPWTLSVATDDNALLASVVVDASETPHVLYISLDGQVRYASPAL